MTPSSGGSVKQSFEKGDSVSFATLFLLPNRLSYLNMLPNNKETKAWSYKWHIHWIIFCNLTYCNIQIFVSKGIIEKNLSLVPCEVS